MPWEYPDESLFCVCDHCHAKAEARKAEAHRELGLIAPWHQKYVVSMLRQMQLLLVAGVPEQQLENFTVERVS